jgi:hypothetical protein
MIRVTSRRVDQSQGFDGASYAVQMVDPAEVNQVIQQLQREGYFMVSIIWSGGVQEIGLTWRPMNAQLECLTELAMAYAAWQEPLDANRRIKAHAAYLASALYA